MDLSRFDALARTVGHGESRRWLLGRLGGTTLGGLLAAGMTSESDARKRKKKKNKKKKCKGCTECETCRKGKCQAQPVGTVCSTGTCLAGGLCSCTFAPGGDDNCPTGCGCNTLPNEEGLVCLQSDGNTEGPQCTSHAKCGRGKRCVLAEIDPVAIYHCVAVCNA